MWGCWRPFVWACAGGLLAVVPLLGSQAIGDIAEPPPGPAPAGDGGAVFARAQDAFYNARYEDAAAQALVLRADAPADLALYELRTSALLFQVKRLLGDDKRKKDELRTCVPCPALLAEFASDTAAAQTLARARLLADPLDDEARFFLGKILLNHVWLQLGPLGRRAGLSEYREARRSLDAVLVRNPGHVRARVARAWIDYIVDTRMPWGTKWIVGGGNRTRGLAAVRDAVTADVDFYTLAEARFALWEMLIRERDVVAAAAVALALATDFPSNPDLAASLTP